VAAGLPDASPGIAVIICRSRSRTLPASRFARAGRQASLDRVRARHLVGGNHCRDTADTPQPSTGPL